MILLHADQKMNISLARSEVACEFCDDLGENYFNVAFSLVSLMAFWSNEKCE